MNKPWLILILIIGTAGVAIALRHQAPGAGTAPPSAPAAGVSSGVATAVEATLPDRRQAVPQAPPTTEERVAGLSAAIWRELNSTNADGRQNVFDNLLPALIALDPAAAARLVEAATHEQGREELLRQLLQSWTASDANAALTWAGQLADTNEQERAFIYATKQMAERDPATAAAIAAQYLSADAQNAVLGDIALTWARQDLAGALNWAAGQPAGEQRDRIMGRLAFMESRTAPEAAANLVIDEIPPGPAQNEAAVSVLHQWAVQDFAAAKAWAELFQAGPLRERVLAELAGIASLTTGRGN